MVLLLSLSLYLISFLSPTDSKAIVDGNLKLILGLVWTLILHYSISMPVWEDEDDEEAKKQTPKQRLLGWIQNKVPDLPITNFSQDWRNGRALGALVDSCAPGELYMSTVSACKAFPSCGSAIVVVFIGQLCAFAPCLSRYGGPAVKHSCPELCVQSTSVVFTTFPYL